MAMKKILLFIVLPALMIMAAAIAYIMKEGRNNAVPEKTIIVFDSLTTILPEDEKLAKKEIQKAKRALAALVPAKPYIVIDTHANRIFLRKGDSIILEATCSTGSGGIFVDSTTGRKWIFNTPLGVFKVDSKIPHPWWRKPDWAFLEEGETIPKDEGERLDPNMMGDYAIGFGDGYFIHGTIYERLLGVSVTHGCVRVASEELEVLYNKTPIGTLVYIF
jgi:L,D-transpeptidase YbiS